jgi:hypothetical protein
LQEEPRADKEVQTRCAGGEAMSPMSESKLGQFMIIFFAVFFLLVLITFAFTSSKFHKDNEAFCAEHGLLYDRENNYECYTGYFDSRTGEADVVLVYAKDYLKQGGDLYECRK